MSDLNRSVPDIKACDFSFAKWDFSSEKSATGATFTPPRPIFQAVLFSFFDKQPPVPTGTGGFRCK